MLNGVGVREAAINCHMQRSLPNGIRHRPALAVHEQDACGISLTAHMLGAMINASEQPVLARWHVTSQDQLFGHLRQLWADDRPRVMVDLGSHVGHGLHRNLSDALNWLHFFNHTGSTVLGVDAIEDYAFDLQYRFDHVSPYQEMRDIDKRSLNLFVGSTDGSDEAIDAGIKALFACCAGRPRTCEWKVIERLNPYHYCWISRKRISKRFILDAANTTCVPLPAPPASSFSQLFIDRSACFRSACDDLPPLPNATSPDGALYHVKTIRGDTLWAEHLSRRQIDFVKIDVNAPWHSLGIEALFAERAFSVMTIEVDQSWGNMSGAGIHSHVSTADQLVWFARRYEYNSYLKVPCVAATSTSAGMEANWSAWYFPLANTSKPYSPRGLSVDTLGGFRAVWKTWGIQDLLFLDARDRSLDRLTQVALAGCASTSLAASTPTSVQAKRERMFALLTQARRGREEGAARFRREMPARPRTRPSLRRRPTAP